MERTDKAKQVNFFRRQTGSRRCKQHQPNYLETNDPTEEQSQVNKSSKKKAKPEERKVIIEMTPPDEEELRILKLTQNHKYLQRRKKKMDDLKRNEPEKYREYLDKVRFKAMERRMLMAEEKKEELKQKEYFLKQAREAKLTPEELANKKRIKFESIKRSMKKRWEEATEEEKNIKRIDGRFKQRKRKLRNKLFSEGLGREEVKKMADEEEEKWWREVFPEGRPPPKKQGRKVNSVWLPGQESTSGESKEVKVFNFTCVKCYPVWIMGCRKWQPVGFNKKVDLLEHVLDKHPNNYHMCEKCSLLKYSEDDLLNHKKYCINRNKFQ